MHTNWTDRQWDEWNRRRVTMDLDFFDSLATAVELLQSGKRLNKEERECWTTTVKSCQSVIAEHSAVIDRMEDKCTK